MSIVFSDTTNYRGIIQLYEKEIGYQRGDVSDSEDLLKEATADVNNAYDRFLALAIPAGGTWQYDDSNHTDYPEITTDIVSGQRSYTFTEDEQGNIILDIYTGFVKDENGIYRKMDAVDKQSERDMEGFYDGQDLGGVPTRYDKTGNGIFLDRVPNYNADDGLKLYINREALYFTYTDTTKKPGVIGLFHAYFYLEPAMQYAARNGLTIYPTLVDRVMKMEREIELHYGKRNRDRRKGLRPLVENNR